MDTPFGLRRHLLITLPEIRAATVSIPSPQFLAVKYVPDAAGRPEHRTITEWVDKNRTAGTACSVDRVDAIADAELPTAQLDGTSLPVDVAEDAAININGLIEFLRRRWPDDFVRFEDGAGHVRCVVTADSTVETRTAMQREVSLLLHGGEVEVVTAPTVTPRPHAASRAELVLAQDWEQMHDRCNEAVSGRHRPDPLPGGVFAFYPTKASSLFCHLTVAERVFVEMPTNTEDVASRYGVSWGDFIDALDTGRVIPVFRSIARSYEPGMIDAVLDAGGRCVLPGESRLRELAAFVAEAPCIALASALEEHWRETHAIARRHPSTGWLVPFFDAVAAAAERTRLIARRGEHMAKVWAPLAFALDDALQSLGQPRRDFEFVTAIDTARAAEGCGARPLVPDGDLHGEYVRLVYGAPRKATRKPGDGAIVEEPEVVSKFVLPRVGGLSLREFANSFNGPAIKAMHHLVQSPRLEGGKVDEVVRVHPRDAPLPRPFEQGWQGIRLRRQRRVGTGRALTGLGILLRGGWRRHQVPHGAFSRDRRTTRQACRRHQGRRLPRTDRRYDQQPVIYERRGSSRECAYSVTVLSRYRHELGVRLLPAPDRRSRDERIDKALRHRGDHREGYGVRARR